MRDRLIELISQVQYMGGLEGRLADYLLANGVILPPCKVGDKLYAINASQTRVHQHIVTHLEVYESGVKIFGRPSYCQQEYWMCWAEDLGDMNGCVFLTREEAERALERSGNE